MRKNMFAGIVPFLFIIVVSYFGVYKLAVKELPRLSPYQSAHLHFYASSDPTKVGNYAITVDPTQGEFRFAEYNDKDMGVRLWVSKSARLIIKTDPRYPTAQCDDQSVDQARLRIISPHVQSSTKLITGQQTPIEFQAYKGDQLKINVVNEVQKGCGNTFLKLYEKNNVRDYPLLFMAVWCCFILLCLRFNLPLFIPVVGAGINCLLVIITATMQVQSLSVLMYTTVLSGVLSGIWLLILGLSTNLFIRTVFIFIALVAFVSVPTVFGGHFLAFDSAPTIDTVHAILQSHKYQIIEFWKNVLGWKYSLILTVLMAAIIWAVVISAKTSLNRKAAICLGIILIAFGVRDYSVYLDINPMLHITGKATASYFQELEAYQKLEASRKSGVDQIEASTTQTDSILIVVIGESANKYHMSTYGYPRTTTPNTDTLVEQGSMLRFNEAYSNHIYSNPTISRGLTEASNYNGLQWSGTPSAIHLANAAGISTIWISNKLRFGPWDNVMSVIGDDAQQTIHINTKVGKNLISNRFDGALVPLVEQALTDSSIIKSRDSKAIFVHLQGSHVEYKSRYPKTHEKFREDLDPWKFGSVVDLPTYHAGVINTYDNSIYYTDSVIQEVISLLGNNNKPIALLYFADHGENVFGRKSHNAALFEYDMTEIPMLFWANEPWQNRYQDKWKNMQSNIDAVFTNDHIFDTILGLLDIESEHTYPENDISTNKYKEPENPTTLHGKRPLKHSDNTGFWFRENYAHLQRQRPDIDIGARGTTVGHVKQIFSEGIEKAYVDIEFLEQNNGLFVSQSGKLSQITVDQYIQKLEIDKTDKIALRLKATSVNNNQAVAEQVQLLLEKYRIGKQISLIVDFQNLGISTLLSGDIAMGSNLPSDLNESSVKKLTTYIDNNDITMLFISTDEYGVFKERVMPNLAESGLYVIADAVHQLSFHSPDTANMLKEQAYLNDLDIDEVVLTFESPFSISVD